MIVIHQMKAAGSSLVAGLCRDFGLVERPGDAFRPTINSLNAKKDQLREELLKLQGGDKPVASFHLHPTKEILEIFESDQIKAIVLLRNPLDSYNALSRHTTPDNRFKRSHAALRDHRESALERLVEFNRNWRTLKDNDGLLFLRFEDVISDYQQIIERVSAFYGIEPLESGQSGKALPKVRFTGHGGTGPTELTKADEPTFRYQDFRTKKFFYRRLGETFPRLYRLKQRWKTARRHFLSRIKP